MKFEIGKGRPVLPDYWTAAREFVESLRGLDPEELETRYREARERQMGVLDRLSSDRRYIAGLRRAADTGGLNAGTRRATADTAERDLEARRVEYDLVCCRKYALAILTGRYDDAVHESLARAPHVEFASAHGVFGFVAAVARRETLAQRAAEGRSL